MEGAQERVVDALAARPGEPLRRGAIMEATGLGAYVFKGAISKLLSDGRIVKQGERAAARYRLPDEEATTENPEPAPALAPAPSLPPRRSAEAAGPASQRAAKGRDRQRAIRDAVEESGAEGITGEAIAAALGTTKPSVRGTLTQLVSRGVVVSDSGMTDEQTRYHAAALGILPADENGAKTGAERRIVAALDAAPVALTSGEVGANAEVRGDVASMLSALARRDVVTVLPRSGDNEPARWQLVVRGAAAA